MFDFFHQTNLKLGMKFGLIAQHSSGSNLVFSTILLDFSIDKKILLALMKRSLEPMERSFVCFSLHLPRSLSLFSSSSEHQCLLCNVITICLDHRFTSFFASLWLCLILYFRLHLCRKGCGKHNFLFFLESIVHRLFRTLVIQCFHSNL